MLIKPSGTKGKKISKLIMILGLVLLISGAGIIAVLGLNNLSTNVFSLVFLIMLLGVFLISIGYSGYSGKIVSPHY